MAVINTSSDLIARLRRTLVRQRLVWSVAGLLATVAVATAIWIILTLAANVMILPVWFKLVLLVAALAVVSYFIVRYVLTRMLEGDVEQVALRLEARHTDLKGRLIAAVQFARSASLSTYSTDLVALTEKQALSRASGLDFDEVVSFHPIWKTGRQFLVATLAAVLLLAAAPGFFGYALEVYSNPTERVAPPTAYRLVVAPESTEWVKYKDVTIGGAVVGLRLPEKAYISHRLAGGHWQKTEIDLGALPRTAVGDGDSLPFGLTLRQINRSFDYFVQAGELRSDVQVIDVVDRPRVTGIALSIFYPAYTGLAPATIDENNGSFSAVTGSRVNLKIETNLPVERAELVFDDSSRTPLAITGAFAEASLAVDRSRAYRIELVDHLGEHNPDPIEYYITAIPDEYPSIDVVRPGFDVNLNDDMMLPLLVRIYDDYGFTSLVLKYRVFQAGRASDETVAVLHFSDRIKTEGDIEFNWDLDRLNLFPGDYVAYYLEVADNDVVSGPKITKSRAFLARVPSLDEIVAQAEQESMQRISNVEQLVRTGKELSRRLQNAARKLEAEMNANQQADWQQQKEVEDIAQKNQEMLRQIEQTAEQMEKSLEKMQENSLMSREIMEKLQEIHKLFEEVATPEMREAQRRLMEQLQKMDREQLLQAMKDFEMSQEELLERLERTLALLKRMQVEAKMEAMIRRVEELAKMQEKVNNDTEGSEQKNLPDLGPSEDQNREALEQLKKEASDLRSLMAEAEMSDVPEAQKFAETVENTDANQNMGQMSQALRQQQQAQALEQGKTAESKLLQMLDTMRQMQMALSGDDTEKIRSELQRSIEHSNSLSQKQEEVFEEARLVDPQSAVLHDVARLQQDLASSCNGLKKTIGDLGKQSPFIAAELQSLVNTAIQNMDMATISLGEKNRDALNYQNEAMYSLNRATTRMMESLDQLNQCQNGSNCSKPMAKLEGLCNRQNQLNQASQGMCNKPGQSSQDQNMTDDQWREGMQRLAGEQGAIRKSLQELEQEFGDSRQILGRLSDIAGEMQEVEEALGDGELGPETTERQLRIHSRMLEAARSLQRKDFTDKRQATTATETPVFVPRALPADLLNDRTQLEDRLRRFLGDSYPPQYEEQIKAYFRALLNVGSEPTANPQAEPVTPER